MQDSTNPAKVTVENVARALDPGARQVHENKYTLRCPNPGHEDVNPSAYIYRHDKTGGIMLGCSVCGNDQKAFYERCKREGIKLGLKSEDKKPVIENLYPYYDYSGNFTTAVKERYCRPDGGKVKKSDKARWATYFEVNATGELRFREARRPEMRYLPLYNGHKVGDASRVYVVEGEKDCETLRNRHVAAVSIPAASGDFWSTETEELLTGREVVLIPDRDAAGESAMDRFGAACCRADIEVRRLELPVTGAGEDVTDWFRDYQGTGKKLDKLADRAPVCELEDFEWRASLVYTRDGDLRPVYGNACTILRNAPEFRGRLRYDDFHQQPILDGARPTEVDPGKLGNEMQDRYGLVFSRPQPVKDAALIVASEDRFDSLREHVESLEGWDGVERLDTWLRDYCGAIDPFSAVAGRKFLIGMIARAMEPGCKFDTALVLEGPQGKGKSSVCEILGGEFYLDAMPDLQNKTRTSEEIQGKWLVEDAEMESASRAEVKRLKSFLSTRKDRFRGAYRTDPVDAPRRCVIVITTNRDDYLVDETGDRRFWPIVCGNEDFDLGGLRAVRDQLFAEAHALWAFGEPPYLVGDEQDLQRGEARKRFELEASNYAELLDWYLTHTPNGRRGQGTKRAEPLVVLHLPTMIDELRGAEKLSHDVGTQAASRQFGRLLNHRGWTKRVATYGTVQAKVWTGRGSILTTDPRSNTTSIG